MIVKILKDLILFRIAIEIWFRMLQVPEKKYRN